MMEQILNKFEDCLNTWSDLPEYIYTEEYKAAFINFAKLGLKKGLDPNNLVVMTLHHETDDRRPYFEFNRA